MSKNERRSMGDGALKPSDAWVEVLAIDPITLPIARLVSRISWVHPLHFTILALTVRLLAAWQFAFASLFFGGAFAFGGMLFDGLDGKVARIKQKMIVIHGTTDVILDQFANSVMALALMVRMLRDDSDLTVLFIGLWLALWLVYLNVTSNKHRLISELGGFPKNRGARLALYKEDFANLSPALGSALNKLGTLAVNAELACNRLRTTFRPTVIESEFVLFVVGPLIGAMTISAGVAALLVVPDTVLELAFVAVLVARRSRVEE